MPAVPVLIVVLNHVKSCLSYHKMRNSCAINVGIMLSPWNDSYRKIEQINILKGKLV